MRRKWILFLALSFSMDALSVEASDQSNEEVDWDVVVSSAKAYVAQESPDEVWPFHKPPYEELVGGEKKVFAHYFSPFPLSFDNKPAEEDTYSRVHLSPEGSDRVLDGRGGYKAGGGGALRQRPLPVEPWTVPEWRQINLAIEVLRARMIGLDGFAYDMLGVSPGSSHRETLEILLDVVERVSPEFKIMLMPDMNSELRRKPEILAEVIYELSDSPSLYRLEDGRLLISPYNAAAQPPEYWKGVMDDLESKGVATAFLPVFVGYQHLEKNAQAYGSLAYGLSDWGFRDIQFAKEFDFKNSAQKARAFSPIWMMPVSPQDVRAKGLIAWEAENTRAFRYLWDAAIDGGSQYVHLVTWNDYGEASEISPSSGTQFSYYDLTAYYTIWFKTGKAPEITEDAFYYTHRTQIFPFPDGVTAEKQREPFRQAGKTPFRNDIEMVALLTAPAVLEIEQAGNMERIDAEAGLTAFSVPLHEGTPVMRIVRDGEVILERSSIWAVQSGGEVENPVYHGGSSTRP